MYNQFDKSLVVVFCVRSNYSLWLLLLREMFRDLEQEDTLSSFPHYLEFWRRLTPILTNITNIVHELTILRVQIFFICNTTITFSIRVHRLKNSHFMFTVNYAWNCYIWYWCAIGFVKLIQKDKNKNKLTSLLFSSMYMYIKSLTFISIA